MVITVEYMDRNLGRAPSLHLSQLKYYSCDMNIRQQRGAEDIRCIFDQIQLIVEGTLDRLALLAFERCCPEPSLIIPLPFSTPMPPLLSLASRA